MAVNPDLYNLPDREEDRIWDIVFVGNRYKDREVREAGEKQVLLPALQWALKNGKLIGVWGKGLSAPDMFTWRNLPQVWNAPGVYQHETLRLESMKVYKRAKVVLSYTSCPNGETMLPNRLLQAAACGCIILSQKTPATDYILAGNYFVTRSAEETGKQLTRIFSDMPAAWEVARKCRAHVLANHTFVNRLKDILGVLGEPI
jgi:spore maturation protein CgeB